MNTHQNAALRALREALVRTEDWRKEAIEAMDDPRLPTGVGASMVAELSRDIEELASAVVMIERASSPSLRRVV